MYINNFREKLKKRFTAVIQSDQKTVDTNLSLLLDFLRTNTITKSILDELTSRKIYNEDWKPIIGRNRRIVNLNLPDNELDYATISLSLLDQCSQKSGLLSKKGSSISGEKRIDAGIKYFNKIFTKKLYEYIDERIEDGNLILYILNGFKARSEWFNKNELYELYQSNTRHGEENLTKELRKFLFDQGIDYPFSEPLSPSGKPDLVHGIGGDNPLTLEVKLFDPARSYNRAYIRRGFHQAFRSAKDYNQPFGYLLIFNLSDYDIKFGTESQNKQIKIDFGDKTIYIVVINLFESESASKKGKMKPYEINEDYLISEPI